MLFPPVEDSCEITIAAMPSHFSASHVARAIEDCDAHLINLNVLHRTLDSGELTVMLRATLANPEPAIRALERYGYRVIEIHTSNPDAANDSLQTRIDELLVHLGI